MQITRQADYAIRAVRYLAQQGTEENIAIRATARAKKLAERTTANKKAVVTSEDEKKTVKDLNVPTSEVAKAMNIPASFLAKIISQLSIAGLLSTSRGASGGVTLKREPKYISVLDVVEAIDGPILLNECVGNNKHCDFEGECLVHPIWIEVQESLVKRLRETRFDVLFDKA